MKLAAIATSVMVGIIIIAALFFGKSNSKLTPSDGVVTVNAGIANTSTTNQVNNTLITEVTETPARHSPETLDHDTLAEAASRENRDTDWASQNEKQIRGNLSGVAGVRAINVDCRSTLCNITAEIAQSGNEKLGEVIERASHSYSPGVSNNGKNLREITTSYSVVSASPYVIRFSQLLASDR